MLNQVVLVGRLAKEVELKELESGKKVANITLAIPRPFKNEDGTKNKVQEIIAEKVTFLSSKKVDE